MNAECRAAKTAVVAAYEAADAAEATYSWRTNYATSREEAFANAVAAAAVAKLEYTKAREKLVNARLAYAEAKEEARR